MKSFPGFLLAFVMLLSLCANAVARGTGFESETRLLEAELQLAKKPIIYFIFNLKNREVLLKARGVLLRDMKIEDVKVWGVAVEIKPRPLLKKSAMFEPKRENIDPDKNKEEETDTNTAPKPGTFDIEALELQDMPASYRLEFQEGIFISVRSKSAGFTSKLYNIASYLGWHVSRPALTIWNSIKGRPYTSIYLTLSEEDARSIYWSLVENSENIIVHP
ncbi:MAG: hypothetical protein C4560_05470 [Nitrospiraceae bacterium]|nr:MAG: hypothetical protein C4560_05470 [Nitrospiraceae bacterium]